MIGRSRRALVRRTRKPIDAFPITLDKGLFLGAAPALDSALEDDRFFTSRGRRAPNQFHWSSPPGPFATNALLMLPEASFDIFRMSCVVRTVTAPQHVNAEINHLLMPLDYGPSGLRSGRTDC